MSLSERFEAAAAEVKTVLTEKPTNEELLELYGLFKQAKEGDNTTAQPWAVQLEASAKWKAWTALKGTSKDDAMTKYIALVDSLKAKYATK
ncbi:acyl-CoA binding protein [Heterostelium album PN500]|uniref:Acyl-CoA binding protein n=1 Tax=Heterostelium pallidum (strain ATCC 26659 / Pp 5 / PN500) TaxID=670386 RepID=D3BG33_HETP5|nr:acyl-CoA binding protein [Heterostelium album PN500]EFA79625.1 acyl-CoA binding protein [Heterostelium album PN500]|eukprot:XP_020431746.1 acyl-CoA binding protein [Heterostelium album PN500]